MAALVELKPFRTCLERPLKKPKGLFEFNYNIQIFLKKDNGNRCVIIS